MSAKLLLTTGMFLYDLITADQNAGISGNDRKIPWIQMLSRGEISDLRNFAIERIIGIPNH